MPQEISIIEPKGPTSKIHSKVFCYFKGGVALLEKHDPDFERSLKVTANLVEVYACYSENTEKRKDYLTDRSPETTSSLQHHPKALLLLLLLQEVHENLQQESV